MAHTKRRKTGRAEEKIEKERYGKKGEQNRGEARAERAKIEKYAASDDEREQEWRAADQERQWKRGRWRAQLSRTPNP